LLFDVPRTLPYLGYRLSSKVSRSVAEKFPAGTYVTCGTATDGPSGRGTGRGRGREPSRPGRRRACWRTGGVPRGPAVASSCSWILCTGSQVSVCNLPRPLPRSLARVGG
jgi:hypothetical protein